MKFKYYLSILLAIVPIWATANEFGDRNQIIAMAQLMFRSGEFDRLETYYSNFDKSDERLGSGLHKSGIVLRGIEALSSLPNSLKVRNLEPAAKKEQDAKSIAFFLDLEEKAAVWQKKYPTSSLAAFSKSKTHIQHAFFYRGTRLAKEVDPQMWKPYEAQIDKASQAFEPKQLSRDKAWYLGMMQLAQFSNMDLRQFSGLFEEATNKNPYFYELYYAAANKLDPKWGGSLEAFEWLALQAVNKTKQNERQTMYARVYWHISSIGYEELFTSTKADWSKMKAGFDDIMGRYPSEWNLNAYAKLACIAKDVPTLKKTLGQLGDAISPQIWNQPEQLTRCRRLARETP